MANLIRDSVAGQCLRLMCNPIWLRYDEERSDYDHQCKKPQHNNTILVAGIRTTTKKTRRTGPNQVADAIKKRRNEEPYKMTLTLTLARRGERFRRPVRRQRRHLWRL